MSNINKWQGSPMDQISIEEVEECLNKSGSNIDRLKQIKPATLD